MFFEGERWPGEIHIARASVQQEIDRQPAAHVYFDVHVDWLEFDDHLKKLGGLTGTAPLV